MKYFQIHRDNAGRIRRVRILHDMGEKPSIVWNRDDDYDRPKFRIGWLPWFRVTYYPGLRPPIEYTVAGRRGGIQSWRSWRRRLRLVMARV